MEQINYVYNDGEKNIVGMVIGNDKTIIKNYVPNGTSYYIFTDDDVKSFNGAPPETWVLSGDADGVGIMGAETK